MNSMACVDLPAFPLQVLLRRHPGWRELPAAVVDEDRPQGMLLWVNERARAERILPGMRYAGALSLARELRAGVVSPAEIEAEIEALATRLRFFSPEVERARDDPGTFWLGAEGLGLLHPEFPGWAALIRSDLRQAGYDGRVAVGFSRFGCYAAARAAADLVVFADPEHERDAVRRIPIDRIACEADLRDTLARLGIFELGGFLDLPPSGIRRRFGDAAFALHRLARGETWTPLDPEIPEEPHERRIILDHPETNAARLLHALQDDLQALLCRLGREDRALRGLAVEITFDRPGPDGPDRRLETLRPATPTRDLDLVLDLLRLRLESIRFPSGAVEIRLEADFAGAPSEQLGLFPEEHRRDLAAANRALARVRAESGDGAVCTAHLIEAHLPEARFALSPLERLTAAQPRKVRTAPVMRRILSRPEPVLLDRPRAPAPEARTAPERGENPAGLVLRGVGVLVDAAGPFIVSGGWWRREVVRHYWYVRVERASPARDALRPDEVWLWIYRDRRRRRWYRQGGVE